MDYLEYAYLQIRQVKQRSRARGNGTRCACFAGLTLTGGYASRRFPRAAIELALGTG